MCCSIVCFIFFLLLISINAILVLSFVNVNLLIDNNVNQIMSIDLSYLKDICSIVLFPMTSPKRKAFFDRYLHKLVYLDLPYFRSCVPTQEVTRWSCISWRDSQVSIRKDPSSLPQRCS